MNRARFSRVRVAVVAAVSALVAAAAQLVPAAPPVGAAPVAASAAARVAEISWTACGGGFQCATFAVPLDYGSPAGPRISLRLTRLPAGDPDRRIGSLLMNPGGPGGSGIDLVRGIGPILPLELRGRFDLVGFDPRGILASTPLRCFDTLDQSLAVVPQFAFPYTPAEEDQVRTLDGQLAQACATHGGLIRDHMSTADVARDMDVLRAALGDEKLSYLGFSYGSYLGQVYANMFPDRVRAIAIDGIIDPVAWSTGRGAEGTTLPVTTRLRSDVGAQDTLGEFFRLCDDAGTACALAPGSAQRYATLIARARQAPLVIGTPPNTYTVTYADIVGATLGALYVPFLWPVLAQDLRDLEPPLSPAQVGAPFHRVRHRLGLDNVPQQQQAPQEQYPNFVEGFPGVLCADSVNPNSFSAWPAAAAAAEQQNGYFGRIWTWISSPCLPWPSTAGQDRYSGPWTASTSSPVLVVGNYFDPATAYASAVTASQLLPNSTLLTYAGWGHTAFFGGSYCVDAAVTAYLTTQVTPPAGTVCPPAASPFESVGATQQQRAEALIELGLPMLPAGVRQALRTRAR